MNNQIEHGKRICVPWLSALQGTCVSTWMKFLMPEYHSQQGKTNDPMWSSLWHQTSSRDHFTYPRTYFWRRHQDSRCTRPISTSYQPNSPSGWRSREIFRSETTKKGRKFQKISRSTTKQSLNKHKRNLKAEIALKLVIWFQSKLIRSRRPPQSIQYAPGKDYTATSISSRTRKTS